MTQIRVYECDEAEFPALKKALEYDPYLDKGVGEEELKKMEAEKSPKVNVIFARQSFDTKAGAAVGLEANKYYLYLKANDEFFVGAEARFKNEFKTVKRADPEAEKTIIDIINEEESKGNYGVGMVFGD